MEPAPPAGAGPELSIVVVSWNAGPALSACLASVRRHAPSLRWDCVVVDNASTDGSAEAAGAAHPWARVVRNDRNRGLAAANNQGMRLTSGRLILIANPDVELTAGAVDAMVAVMARRPRAAFVVPRLAFPDGRAQTSAGDLPTVADALLGRAWSHRRARDATSGFWWDGWAHDRERRIGRGAEACYLVRRAALDEIGPQDERFFLDWEGIDWTARARAAGWEVWLAPDATVVHTGGVSVRRAGLRWVRWSHAGMYRYLAPRVPAPARPLLAAAVAARAVAKGAAVLAGAPLYRWAQGR